MALLGHFERLATPHIPRDSVVDVDRRVREAVRVGKQLQKRMLHEGTWALSSPEQDKELPTTPRADHQELEVRAPDAKCADSADRAPICSGGKPWGSPEALSVVSKTPSPTAPFCVDTSLEAFRSFLDLVKGIRQMLSPVPAAPARKPDEADSPTGPNGKRPTCKAQTSTEAIGPESCEEPTAGSLAKGETPGKNSKHQHPAPAPPNVDGYAVAPQSVQMEVLRSTLRLLKVNIFHLVRSAAMRRGCREKCVVKQPPETGENLTPIEGHKGSAGADKESFTRGVVGGSGRLQPRGSRTGDGTSDAEKGNEKTPSVTQGVKFETLSQDGYPGPRERAEDMHGVIQELHAELRTILEDIGADTDPGTTNEALAVQVRSSRVAGCPSILPTRLGK